MSWIWNFGDTDSTTSSEINPTYIYENQGTYKVTLQVADAFQNVFRTSRQITVAKAEFPAEVVWEFTHNAVVARRNEGSNAPVSASVHDSQATEDLLDKGDEGQPMHADSAYTGEKQEGLMAKFKMENQVPEKGYKNSPLTEDQKKGNTKNQGQGQG